MSMSLSMVHVELRQLVADNSTMVMVISLQYGTLNVIPGCLGFPGIETSIPEFP